MSHTVELDQSYVAGTYGRFPLEIVSGKGALLLDESGKEYIDLGTGIAVNTFGMCDEEWVRAVSEQLGTFQHTSNLYYSAPCARLAEILCTRTGMKKVFFGNSGAEANECAIKTARQYGITKKGREYYHIITLKNSFHGRTITTLAATGQDVFHKDFTPLTEGFLYAEADNLASVEELVKANSCAAVMMEMVQGEGGVYALSSEFVRGVEKICRENDLCLIVDEVQTGNGRTGKLYAYMHHGITPDIVTTAKGLGGGLPIGACLLGERVENVLGPGMHGSTFGGNPAVCAGAVNILSRIDEELLAGVKARADYIRRELSGAPGVKSVSGLGLMIGVETEKDAKELLHALMARGVLVLTAKTKLRLLPPLNIPMELLEKAVAMIKEELAK